MRARHRPRPASFTRPARALVAGVALAAAFAGCRAPAPEIHTRAGTAMGTVVEMKVVCADEVAAGRALDAAFEELRRVERIATPHDPGSELSRINARTDSAFVAGAELDDMIAQSLDVAARSGGAFDPTIGALVRAWGFPDHPMLASPEAVAEARRHVDWTRLHRGDGPGAWVDPDPDALLDLGGIAKGWGVDRATDVLARTGACLVNAGGDLACRGSKPDGGDWVVGVQHPRQADALYCRVRVPQGLAIATSGDYERFLEVDGVRYHHLLDPSTGAPARGVASATVVAPTCALADAWATASFVLGPERGIAALEREPGLEGLLLVVNPDGTLAAHETSGFAALRLP